MVSSVDGRAITATQNAAGLGDATDQRVMHRLRLASEGVLVGGETLRRDPFMPTFNPDLAAERARYFPHLPQPWGIVVSRNGDLPLDKKFFQTGPAQRIVALGPATPADRVKAFQAVARVVEVPLDSQGQLDLAWLLEYLYQEIGLKRLLCEGGPSLNYSLIAKNLADELFWTLAPKLVAAHDNSSIIMGAAAGFAASDMPRLRLRSLYEKDSELFLRYTITQP